MNFLQITAIAIFCLFFECNCRSVHLHEETRPAFPADEGKPMIHRHENKDTVSWMKLKPILHRELKERSKSKDAKPAELFENDVHYTQSSIKANSEIVNRSEHKSYIETASKRTDTDQINIAENVTLIRGKESDFSELPTPNVSKSATGKLETLHKSEYPYNITSDILAQKGDLILFLAVNDKENKTDHDIDNQTSLIEGTTVSVEEISITEYELLRDFEKQQNLHDTKLHHMQVNLTHNLSNLENELKMEATQLSFDDEPEHKELEESPTIGEGEIVTKMSNLKAEIVVETSPNDKKSGLILNNLTNFENVQELSSDSTSSQNLELELQEVEESSTFREEEIVNGMAVNLKEEISFEKSPSDENSGLKLNTNNFKTFKNGEQVSSDSTFSQNVIFDSEDKMLNESSASRADLNKHINESDNIEEILTHSLEKENVPNTNGSDSKCPDPGVCIFWFLAFDTCEEDSHCFGSLNCCMWGCSKLCIDINSEFPENIF